ncbi:MAG: 1-deoxy-D-xylulose-5-phosphate reductoisomerase [Gammaproteobacteria bacterium]
MSVLESSLKPVPSGPIGVTILGATGSIGMSTLDVISRHPDKYRVIALTANQQVDRLISQCRDFKPQYAVLADRDAANTANEKMKEAGLSTQVLSGIEGLEKVVALKETQQVMAAIVGAAGLRPTLAAAKAGKRILLANKEALVMSGKIFMDEVKSNNAELLPIDSEHNAIFQSMPAGYSKGLNEVGVKRILLTASGGPFREADASTLENVTPEQACDHPNWKMGKKISVDSATMMNKGLEVIEACWLFGTSPDKIQVVIHPQSIIHSLVAYEDGSVIAQLGNPDMRTPIAHAMAWPERMTSGVADLDLFETSQLNFERPDMERFPCLQLAYDAMNIGGTAPAILNAANEVAVQAFLDKKISFINIPNIIKRTLSKIKSAEAASLDVVLAADTSARDFAQSVVAGEVQ